MSRLLLSTVALLYMSGCGSPECAPGELVVDVTLAPAAAVSDAVDVVLTIDGKSWTATGPHRRGATSGQLAVAVPGYAAGKRVGVRATATAGGQALAAGTATVTLAARCMSLPLSLTAITPPAPIGLAFELADFYQGNPVAVGDVDGDGKPDIVASDQQALLILRNDGKGGFSQVQSLDAPTATIYRGTAAIADVDGDKRPDVIGAGSLAIAIYHGQPDGTLGAATLVPLSSGVTAVSAGDIDHDGRPDIAATLLSADGTTSGIVVLRNRGDGTFSEIQPYPANTYPQAVALADLDGDGNADLIGVGYKDQVTIVRSNGDGSFGAPVRYDAGLSYASSLAVRDYDGDGHPDLVLDGGIILRNQGDGTFAPGGTFQGSVAPGDFDGNGTIDLAVVSTYSVELWLRSSDGTLTPGPSYGFGGAPTRPPFPVDVDGDGNVDLVSAMLDQGTAVLRGRGKAAFAGPRLVPLAVAVGAVAVADFDGDARLDIAAVGSTADDRGQLFVLHGDGHGGFTAQPAYDVQRRPVSLAAGDLDGDGKPDLALVQDNTDAVNQGRMLRLLLNRGDGTFGTGVDLAAGDPPRSVGLGDLDGDGKPDLFVATDMSIVVLLNRGGGSFAAPRSFPIAAFSDEIAVADFDGDGHADVAAAGTDALTVALADGAGGLRAPVTYSLLRLRALQARDVDGDGHLDLVATDYGGPLVFPGRGDGTFAAPVRVINQTPGTIVGAGDVAAFGDFDGDGTVDCLAAGSGTAVFSVFTHDRSGGFSGAFNFVGGAAIGPSVSADLDGNGRADVVLGSTTGVLVVMNGGK